MEPAGTRSPASSPKSIALGSTPASPRHASPRVASSIPCAISSRPPTVPMTAAFSRSQKSLPPSCNPSDAPVASSHPCSAAPGIAATSAPPIAIGPAGHRGSYQRHCPHHPARPRTASPSHRSTQRLCQPLPLDLRAAAQMPPRRRQPGLRGALRNCLRTPPRPRLGSRGKGNPLSPRPRRARALERSLSRLEPGSPRPLRGRTSRAEAQVLRLSAIYAALDCSSIVALPHLQAALAVWEYCATGAPLLFGTSTGDHTADRIKQALDASPHGLSRMQIRGLSWPSR
jgi:hypothetical protein